MFKWRRGGGDPDPGTAPEPTGAGGDQSGPQPVGHPGRRALREIGQLRERVDELEVALTECMRLNRRLADVTDAVAEVLLPADQRDEARIRELLDGYDHGV